MEDEVVSLEIAEKLKGLGVKQESLWFWAYADDDKEWELILGAELEEYPDEYPYQEMNIFSAFTVAELGSRLRPHLKKDIWLPEIREAMDQVTYMENEANARGEMLIYLLNNKLIKKGG